MDDKYAGIIDLPHHVSKTRRPMPLEERAAQFGSFDALAGFAAVIEGVGREVDLEQGMGDIFPDGPGGETAKSQE